MNDLTCSAHYEKATIIKWTIA